MSKNKKPKKLRRPNLAAAARSGAEGRGGGQETAPVERRAGTPTASSPSRYQAESSRTAFDYAHVIKDLRRIGVLAGGFIAILIALAFIIK